MTNKKRKCLKGVRSIPLYVSCTQHPVNMTRKRSVLLIGLHVICQAYLCNTLNITQSPTRLEVKEGERAIITCSWNALPPVRQIRVSWKLYNIISAERNNETTLASVLWEEKDNVTISPRSHNKRDYIVTKDKAEIHINSATKRDEGMYVCVINFDIPILQRGQGNGTTLNVCQTVQKSNHSGLARISTMLPVMVLIGYCLCIRRKKASIHGKIKIEERIQEYTELDIINADNYDADGQSSTSSNSVKRAVLTIYEYSDYLSIKNPHEDKPKSSTHQSLPDCLDSQ
ncbi:uncharacterized protein LOC128475991 [Spea bombifrons]|uniref:uncharacterized protein LOC128475991 n=1 Tax=Spea bombifrons TaxID=233779 RepID=UPI00234BC11D|nr:uncharacterized protein LOC128475991 [Spea bombifrons]